MIFRRSFLLIQNVLPVSLDALLEAARSLKEKDPREAVSISHAEAQVILRSGGRVFSYRREEFVRIECQGLFFVHYCRARPEDICYLIGTMPLI